MKAIVAALAVTLAALGLNAWVLRSDAAREILVPTPSKVVQAFVGALAAQRPEVAREHLAEPLRVRMSSHGLRGWADDLRARHGTFRYEDASEHREGARTEVHVRLRTRRSGEVDHPFDLAQDPKTHLWKLVSL